MEIKNIIFEEDIAIVELPESFYAKNISKIEKSIDKLIENKKYNKIILDFKSVNFIDSSGIGLLIKIIKKINNGKKKGGIKFCCISTPIINILKQMKLLEIFDVYNSKDEAMESFYDV